MNSIINLSPQQLRQAADVQEKILELQDELNQLLGAPAQVVTAKATSEGRKKFKFSPAARAKMAQAQRERWARIKGTTTESTPEQKPKKKQVNEAQLAALAKAREARWAKVRAAKKEVVSDRKPKVQRSAAWRRAVSLAAKARWAKAKAAGKTTL